MIENAPSMNIFGNNLLTVISNLQRVVFNALEAIGACG
jgi:hypothetical protein